MKTAAEKTIQSLNKINDFPFFTAVYHGDYKIDEFKDGAIKTPIDVVPFFETLFSELGKPTKLSFPRPPKPGPGCSAFFCRSRDNSILIGKNLDWKREPVLLLKTVPEKGYASLSMANLNFCDLFQSGSFEQSLLLSPYVPLDGINETGLVVTMLSIHEGAEYPFSQDKLSVGDFNIIRIILDTCQNIDEAIAVFKKYNIMQTGVLPVHYLVADKEESCIIEFFDGDLHVKRDRKLNYLTNFLKLKSTDYDDEQRIKCDRYQAIEKKLRNCDGWMEVNGAKELLKKTSVFKENFDIPSTIWSLIYIPEKLCMKIKIGDDPKYYSVSLRKK